MTRVVLALVLCAAMTCLGKQIEFYPTPMTNPEAKAFCMEQTVDGMRGRLAMIKNVEDQALVTALELEEPDYSWVGAFLDLKTMTYLWNDGLGLTFTKWDPDETNTIYGKRVEHCIQMVSAYWSPARCNRKFPVLCEFETPPASRDPATIAFVIVNITVNWTEASFACMGLGGRLATIRSAEEQVKVDEALAAYTSFQGLDVWLGAQRPEEDASLSFRWQSGDPEIEYSNWLPAQPDTNNDNNLKACVSAVRASFLGLWNDVRCATELPIMCEVDVVPPPPPPVVTPRSPSFAYVILNFTLPWVTAASACEASLAGKLATIRNQEEQDMVDELLAEYKDWSGLDMWIGAKRTELNVSATFTWQTGSPALDYAHWVIGQPNNQDDKNEACAAVVRFTPNNVGLWIDAPCALEYPALCEVE